MSPQFWCFVGIPFAPDTMQNLKNTLHGLRTPASIWAIAQGKKHLQLGSFPAAYYLWDTIKEKCLGQPFLPEKRRTMPNVLNRVRQLQLTICP